MSERIVYVIQEVAGTQAGNPKINIMGASSYGKLKFFKPCLNLKTSGPGEKIICENSGNKKINLPDVE